MSAKYYCPKCDRRFVDWGAEKLGFECPTCPDEKLLLVGAQDPTSSTRPSLKRKPAKKKAAAKKKKTAAKKKKATSKAASKVADVPSLVEADGEIAVDPAAVPLPALDVATASDDDDDVLAADGGVASVETVPGFESVDEN